jgi:uroporphyrinogen decarboxylase
MGRAKGSRTPLVEYLVDEIVMRPVMTDVLGREWAPWNTERETQRRWLDNFIQFWYRLGYDFVRFERSLDFRKNSLTIPDTAPGSTKLRGWADEHRGTIMSWADFDRYPWPTVEGMDFYPFEYIAAHLPEGMGLMTSHAGGMFEQLSQIMSL